MSSEAASFDREYQALRTARGVVELDGWSSISVTGSDRQTFLHNFCTNDVKRLVPGTSCEAFFTNVKGRIIGHGWIHCRDSELVIFGAPGQGPRLLEHLDRYVIREDVSLHDTTGHRNYILATGETQLEASHESFAWEIVHRGDMKIFDIGQPDTPAVLGDLRDREFISAGPRAFAAVRIEAGMPLYGVDFDEQNFPQEVARDQQAISFTKGCYLGQETVARIDALGHVNQRLVGVRFFAEHLPNVGDELAWKGTKVGAVTSVSFSLALAAPLALAMIRREANAPGTRLESAVGDCEVITLPVGLNLQN